MMNRKGFSRTAALMASCTMFALPAWAQQADTPDPAEENVAADIVVTAQKREERLQDVPIAVSVVSGDLLDRQGAVSLENAQYLVPTLNFRNRVRRSTSRCSCAASVPRPSRSRASRRSRPSSTASSTAARAKRSAT